MAVPSLTRAQLAAVFTDPQVLNAFETLLQQAAGLTPDLAYVNFVVTSADPANAPNGHVLTATGGVSLAIGSGTAALSLANTSVTAGTYSYPTLAIDAAGRITSASSNTPVTSFSGGTTGLTPSSGTSGAVTLGGTLGVANGGTGTAIAFTPGSIVFAGASGIYTQNNGLLVWDDTNFRLGVGTSAPISTLTVKQGSDSDYSKTFVLQRFANGHCWGLVVATDDNLYIGYNNTSVANIDHVTGAYTALSDARLKTNVATYSGGLAAVMALRPVTYEMIADENHTQQLGLIAQEALAIAPYFVSRPADPNGFYGINYAGFAVLALSAIQELKAEFDAYKAAHP